MLPFACRPDPIFQALVRRALLLLPASLAAVTRCTQDIPEERAELQEAEWTRCWPRAAACLPLDAAVRCAGQLLAAHRERPPDCVGLDPYGWLLVYDLLFHQVQLLNGEWLSASCFDPPKIALGGCTVSRTDLGALASIYLPSLGFLGGACAARDRAWREAELRIREGGPPANGEVRLGPGVAPTVPPPFRILPGTHYPIYPPLLPAPRPVPRAQVACAA